jgi:hypothetical protein
VRIEEDEAFRYQTVEFIRKILAEKLWLQTFMLNHYANSSEQARKSFCRAILTVYPKPRDALPLIRQAIAVEVSVTGEPACTRAVLSFSCQLWTDALVLLTHAPCTTEEASLLMREGSIMVDLLRIYFLTVGKAQVAALGPLIKEIVRGPSFIEVDPAMMGPDKGKNIEQNRLNLISVTQKILDKINTTMLSCPRYPFPSFPSHYEFIENHFPMTSAQSTSGDDTVPLQASETIHSRQPGTVSLVLPNHRLLWLLTTIYFMPGEVCSSKHWGASSTCVSFARRLCHRTPLT